MSRSASAPHRPQPGRPADATDQYLRGFGAHQAGLAPLLAEQSVQKSVRRRRQQLQARLLPSACNALADLKNSSMLIITCKQAMSLDHLQKNRRPHWPTVEEALNLIGEVLAMQ